MFRTHQSDIAGVPGMFGDGLAHWHGVSRALSTHWYHLTVKRMVEGRFVNSEEMLNDEARLVEALRAQDESVKVAEVRVVTPSWMNKDSDWKMQKLISLSMGYNKAKVAVCILKVEGGEVYIDSHEPGVSFESLTNVKELYRSRPCNDEAVPKSRGI
ncbi:hypothetical protein SB757_07485 [Pseudomonas sp. SIMBA_065]